VPEALKDPLLEVRMAIAAKKKKTEAPVTYDLIRVEPRRSPEEPRDVVVQVNGYKYQMQREEFIPVPSYVVTVLREAKYKKWDHSNIVNGRPAEYTITRFPFSVLYKNIGEEAYATLQAIAKEKSITQGDIDAALSPEQTDG
jgi:hypothetical protein